MIERIRLQKQIKIKLLFLQFERSQMRCLRHLIRITPRHLLAMSWWEKIMGQTQDMFKGLYLFVDLYIHIREPDSDKNLKMDGWTIALRI